MVKLPLPSRVGVGACIGALVTVRGVIPINLYSWGGGGKDAHTVYLCYHHDLVPITMQTQMGNFVGQTCYRNRVVVPTCVNSLPHSGSLFTISPSPM